MLDNKVKERNRDIYEKYLKEDFCDREQVHVVTVYRDDKIVFQELIPVFIDLVNYQTWGEFKLIVMWEDSGVYDSKEDFNRDGLHGIYSSNFVIFNVDKMAMKLTFKDGKNLIGISI